MITNTNMDAQYFIDKFSAIPDDQWRCDGFYGRDGEPKCALGHCGKRDANPDRRTIESEALYEVILKASPRGVTMLNDGPLENFPQTTPKARILAALEAAKKL